MPRKNKILLQTTIPFNEDDWHVGRFSLLTEHLRSLTGDEGQALYQVTTRDREIDADGNDPVLSSIHESDFDQLWLFALDDGSGLSAADCSGITQFRKRGGSILATRDHNDMGSSLCTLGGVGAAHYFHSRNLDPDQTRNAPDNRETTIDWPNYHSGANGDYQKISAEDHELLRRIDGTPIEYFPAHPHEGGIGAPDDSSRVIATSTSRSTGRTFNLLVAFESVDGLGRAIAESSFHHFVDYNWNIDMGCPSFLDDPPGDGIRREPEKLNDVKRYVENVASWFGETN